jgi:FKBP-type peptidyl-prolyl cis-trans isomerase
MKRLLLTALFVLIGSFSFAQERIAIFPFEDRNTVYTKDELDSFYVEFSNEFRNKTDDRRFTVLTRQDLEKIINMEARFQLSDYSSKEKTAEMQRVLNAGQVLYCLILKVGNEIRITVSRYTFPELSVLRGGKTINVTNKNQLFGKIPELVQAMVNEIAGGTTPAQTNMSAQTQTINKGVLDKNASYALGMNIGSKLKEENLYLDMNEFVQGINDFLTNVKTRYTMEEAEKIYFNNYNAIQEKQETASHQVKSVLDKNASYALGMNIGSSLKKDNLYPDINEFVQGINEILTEAKTRYSTEEAEQIFNEAYNAVLEVIEMMGRLAENEFLTDNSKKPNIRLTSSGLQYEIITQGKGPKPNKLDTVRVHYEGRLINDFVFDSSYLNGEPSEFPLSGVIPGWAEGVQLMNVGGKFRFFIPSYLAYGSAGAGSKIPPYSTLIFEVELLGIVNKK